jgi:hypothetical protein
MHLPSWHSFSSTCHHGTPFFDLPSWHSVYIVPMVPHE